MFLSLKYLTIVLPVFLLTGCSASAGKQLALSEVAGHSTATDCWMAIHGKVYDLTNYINAHPGGEAITLGCGRDATSLFESRPGSGPEAGTSHSESARKTLERFYIGDLWAN